MSWAVIKSNVESLRRLPPTPENANQLSTTWAALADQLKKTNVADYKAFWADLVSGSLIPVIIDALDLSAALDPEGIVASNKAKVVFFVWSIAHLGAEPSPSDVTPEKSALLVKLAQATVRLVESWWSLYKASVSKWREEDVFTSRAEYFALNCYPPLARDEVLPIAKANPAIRNTFKTTPRNPILGEILLVFIVYLNPAKIDDPLFAGSRYRAISYLNHLYDFNFALPSTGLPSTVQLNDLASKCQALFTVDVPGYDGDLYLDALCFVESVSRTPSCAQAMAANDDLAATVGTQFWKWYARKPEKWRNELTVRSMVLITRMMDGPDRQASAKLGKLAQNQDFINLVLKALYIWGKQDIDTTIAAPDSASWDNMTRVCAKSPSSIRTMMRKVDWLRDLDLLRDTKGPQMDKAASVWRKLGDLAGLEEREARKAAIEANKKAAKGLVGCGWYKCILHKQETDKTMHWCQGCKGILYCSYNCQERDWDEGHKDNCRPTR